MSRGAPTLFAGVKTRTALVEGRTRMVELAAAGPWGAGRVMRLERLEGIASHEALDWLGDAREALAGRHLVTLGGRHDVTQWLGGVARGSLRELWARGDSRWYRTGRLQGAERYSLRLIDGHVFSVWREPWPSRVEVREVGALFPGLTLAEACQAWDITSLNGGPIEEACALAELMERVAARGRAIGLRPNRWGAPGAMASAVLRKHKARRYVQPSPRPEVAEAALTAYYGGRVDMLAQGECSRVLSIDMRSAYPWALSLAPSMVGEWLAHSGAGIVDEPVALVHVRRFDSPRLRALTPLPVRTPDRITYPASGAGWYHSCELRAAVRAGAELEIVGGFVFRGAAGEPERPWAWLESLYAQRAELRQAGDEGERLVKLTLNAVYGKLAQSRGESLPYQCYELAGWVTAMVRAAMLDAANLAPARCISIHTDGLLFDASDATHDGLPDAGIALPIGVGMGEWEAHAASNLLIVQPGVYTYDEPGGVAESRRIIGRQRGIAARSLSWDAIEAEWREAGSAGRVIVDQEMHHGIGTCANRRRWGSLGQYRRESRTVSFAATSRFPSSSWSGGLQAMMPVAWSGPAIPYEPGALDEDEQLRREQPL